MCCRKRGRRRKQKGQAIVEYYSVLAFVGVLIAATLAVGMGTLRTSISQCYSTISWELQELATGLP